MIVFEMKAITRDGQPVYEEEGNTTDWWCKIETEEELIVYDDFLKHPFQDHLWNKMVKHAGIPFGVSWGDDDMYGYMLPDSDMPEYGEEYKDGENDIWKRI